jgi:CRP/FNR family cyclic AMP-dependent transcriptional regulator
MPATEESQSMRETQYIVAGLDDADMIWLLSIGALRRVKPGETLIVAGRPIAELYFVLEGKLAVALDDGTLVTRLSASDVIGEMSFIEQRVPAVTVTADEKSEVLSIPRRAIQARFDAEPAFAARFYRALAMALSHKLRETTVAQHYGDAVHSIPEAAHRVEHRFRRLLGFN